MFSLHLLMISILLFSTNSAWFLLYGGFLSLVLESSAKKLTDAELLASSKRSVRPTRSTRRRPPLYELHHLTSKQETETELFNKTTNTNIDLID